MRRKNIIIGTLLIVAAVLVVVFFLVSNCDIEEPAITEEPNTITQLEREALKADLNSNANDEKDLDAETAKQIMNLEVNIPESIENMYFDGDTKLLRETLAQFLIEEDFYMDITWAKCSQTVTMDHLKNIIYLEFSLNDPMHSTVTVTCYMDRGYYDLNYY